MSLLLVHFLSLRESKLRDERSLLDSRQQELAEMRLKEADKKEKQEALERLRTKTAEDLETVYESASVVPPIKRLKEEFTRTREDLSRRKDALQEEAAGLRRDNAVKEAAREDLRKGIQDKKTALEEFDDQVTSRHRDSTNVPPALVTKLRCT